MSFVGRLIRNADASEQDALDHLMGDAVEAALQPDKSDPSFLAHNIERCLSMAKRCREEEAWFQSEIARLTLEMTHRRISAEAFEMAHGRMSDG